MHKILIANRGEIAVRVIRACRDMGLARMRRTLREYEVLGIRTTVPFFR